LRRDAADGGDSTRRALSAELALRRAPAERGDECGGNVHLLPGVDRRLPGRARNQRQQSGRAGRRGGLSLRAAFDFVPGSDQLLSRGGMGAMDTARDREIVSTGGLGGLEGARLRRDVEVVFAGGGVRRAADIRRWNAVHALHGDRLLGQLHLFVARAWTGRSASPLELP